jgi:hypothetical protein
MNLHKLGLDRMREERYLCFNQEGAMPPKRKVPRKWGRRRPATRAKKTPSSKPSAAVLIRRMQDLTERIDIVLPELAARVASLEHLLLDLKLCTHEDLRRARDFVKEQEA